MASLDLDSDDSQGEAAEGCLGTAEDRPPIREGSWEEPRSRSIKARLVHLGIKSGEGAKGDPGKKKEAPGMAKGY